jgi:serine/threonine protein kinase
MEYGVMNLADWRAKVFGKHLNHSEDIALLLLVYFDILSVIESVHAADVVHFDIKCCNFVLRTENLTVERLRVQLCIF